MQAMHDVEYDLVDQYVLIFVADHNKLCGIFMPDTLLISISKRVQRSLRHHTYGRYVQALADSFAVPVRFFPILKRQDRDGPVIHIKHVIIKQRLSRMLTPRFFSRTCQARSSDSEHLGSLATHELVFMHLSPTIMLKPSSQRQSSSAQTHELPSALFVRMYSNRPELWVCTHTVNQFSIAGQEP